MTSIQRTLIASAASFVLMATLGCDKSPQHTYPVRGVIQWSDGQPATELAEATVELQVIEGPQIRVSPRGEVQSNGSFSLTTYRRDDGAPAGSYRAIVMPKQVVDDEIRPPPPILNRRFQAFETSPLELKVESDDNDVVLQVERASAK